MNTDHNNNNNDEDADDGKNSNRIAPIPIEYRRCLLKHFGYSEFRPLQYRIIRSLLVDRHDVCAVMTTGYGKSLTYQFPGLWHYDHVVVVISPLIALMEDQVSALNSRQPNCACLLGSAQLSPNTERDVLALRYRLVFATPEYLTRGSGLKMLCDLGEHLTLIAVDEAHCISEWGHDFRPAYRQLWLLRDTVPKIPLLALTATATPRVCHDISTQLGLRKPLLHICSGFDRPNLAYSVRQQCPPITAMTLNSVWLQLEPYLTQALAGAGGGSVILYSNTVRGAERLAKVVRDHGLPCHCYHGGLERAQRQMVQREFMTNQVRIMAATTAFGMGIDKSNVRLVLHYGAPASLERYCQETGRAGRDNRPAKCVLFCLDSDANMQRRHLQSTVHRGAELVRHMTEYINTKECRRRFILRYFDDKAALAALQLRRRDCCDNCWRPRGVVERLRQPVDMTDDAVLVLRVLRDTHGRVGVGKVAMALRGSTSRSLPEILRQHEDFGRGRAGRGAKAFYRLLTAQLEAIDYIRYDYKQNSRSSVSYVMPQVTLQGCRWLDCDPRHRTPIKLEANDAVLKLLQQLNAKSPITPNSDNNDNLWANDDWDVDLDDIVKAVEKVEREKQKQKSELDNFLHCNDHLEWDFKAIDSAVSDAKELDYLAADIKEIFAHEDMDMDMENGATSKRRKIGI